jgi:hypothetical protein
VSGPGGNALTQPGEGDIGGSDTWACAAEERSSNAIVAAVASRTFRIRIGLSPIYADEWPSMRHRTARTLRERR